VTDVVVSQSDNCIFTAALQPTPHQSKIKDFCQLPLKGKPFSALVRNDSKFS